MATTGLYYLLHFQNAERDADKNLAFQDVYIRIYDRTLMGDDTIDYNVIEADCAGFRTSTVDNSEDKFTGVKPTQAEIRIISSPQVDLDTFTSIDIPANGVDVGDPRWYVEAYLNSYSPTNFIFKGFLNLDDCSETFMPTKNEIVLTANDGLGSLKNIAWTDFNGDVPVDYVTVGDIIAQCLSKTKLDLKLNAVFNIREKNKSTQHFFEAIELHAKTFEDKNGTRINCFDVLEKILSEEAFLTQRCGEWWIIRVDELANTNPYYKAVFNPDGTVNAAVDGGKYYIQRIEKDSAPIYFSQEATTRHPQRPLKYIKESYKFEYPDELIDNIDFSRGDLNFILAIPPVTIDGKTYYQSKSNLDDWTALVGSGGVPGSGSPSTTNNYIRRLFTDSNKTYEVERYLVIEGTLSGGTFFERANKIQVQKNDKFDISVDARYAVDVFPSSGFYRANTIQVRLYGNDGSYYTLAGGTSVDYKQEWVPTNSSFSTNNRFFVIEGNTSEDMTKWKTATWFYNGNDPNPCPPIPVDGQLEILLIHDQNSAYKTDRYFNNLRFTYIPYINGSYSKYSSYYHKISNSLNLVTNRERVVGVSDGIKPLFKGTMFINNGGSYDMATEFFAWNDLQTTSPDSQYIHRYGHIQAYDVWNQYRNLINRFQATMQGLNNSDVDEYLYREYPSLIHRYYLQDATDATDDRYFMLLTFDIDWYLCEWKGTLVEVLNTVTGKSYLDNLETKYEQ